MAGRFELLRVPFPSRNAKSELKVGPSLLTLNHNEEKIFYRTPPGNQRRCSGFRRRVATERPAIEREKREKCSYPVNL